MTTANRPYDIVLFGATGFTGRLTAEHISTHLPTDLKWAIAGRSMNKLEALAAECKHLDPDRIQPRIEICNINGSQLSVLAQKTRLLVSTAGPYSLYGEPVFKACAANGTHYLDVTGEVPWVAKMIKKYETTAKSSGSIMIPQCGIESAPSDMITFALVSMIREKLSVPTQEVTVSVHELSGTPSGGTSATVLGILDDFTIPEIAAAHSPYALSPIPGPTAPSNLSLLTKILGIHTVPTLGLLTSSPSALPNRPIVQRSWGLFGGPSFYGPNFHYHEFMKARNWLTGISIHLGLSLFGILLTLGPFRWVARKFVYGSGEGPTKEQQRKERIEFRAIAVADIDSPNPPRAYGKVQYNGGLYYFTGVLLANAAMTILRDDCEAKRMGGGILTPATLGQCFIDRLNEDGFRFELKILDH